MYPTIHIACPEQPQTIRPALFGCNLEVTRRTFWAGLSAQMLNNRKFFAGTEEPCAWKLAGDAVYSREETGCPRPPGRRRQRSPGRFRPPAVPGPGLPDSSSGRGARGYHAVRRRRRHLRSLDGHRRRTADADSHHISPRRSGVLFLLPAGRRNPAPSPCTPSLSWKRIISTACAGMCWSA